MPREERSKNLAFTSAEFVIRSPHTSVVKKHFDRIDPKKHKIHLLKVAVEAERMDIVSKAFKKLRDPENRYIPDKVEGEKISRYDEIMFLLGGGGKRFRYQKEAFRFMLEQRGRLDLEPLKTALDSKDEKTALNALLEVRQVKHEGVPKTIKGIYPVGKMDMLLFVIGRGKEKNTKEGQEFVLWQRDKMEWLG